MSMNDWLTLAAIVLAPLAAVQVSEYLGRRRQEREERLRVFKILMSTRASALHPSHVEALNLIDVVFAGTSKADRDIRGAWKQYLDHLSQSSTLAPDVWGPSRITLLV